MRPVARYIWRARRAERQRASDTQFAQSPLDLGWSWRARLDALRSVAASLSDPGYPEQVQFLRARLEGKELQSMIRFRGKSDVV